MSIELLSAQVNDVTRDDIVTLMKGLKLTGMIDSYDEIISDMIKRKAPASYAFSQLLKAEVKTRSIKATKNRMNVAKFPEVKDLHDFIFSDTPLNQEQVMNLYSSDFVKTSRNIIAHSTPHLFKTERSKLLNNQPRVHNISYFQQVEMQWTLSHYTKHYTYF